MTPPRSLLCAAASSLVLLAACSAPTAPVASGAPPTSAPASTSAPAPALAGASSVGAGTATATESASSTGPADEDEKELRTAVQAYSDAYLVGRADPAYALLSARCQKRMGRDGFAVLVAAAGRTYGSALPLTSFTAARSGDMARVSYTFPVSAIDQDAEPWVKEKGQWREDDC